MCLLFCFVRLVLSEQWKDSGQVIGSLGRQLSGYSGPSDAMTPGRLSYPCGGRLFQWILHQVCPGLVSVRPLSHGLKSCHNLWSQGDIHLYVGTFVCPVLDRHDHLNGHRLAMKSGRSAFTQARYSQALYLASSHPERPA